MVGRQIARLDRVLRVCIAGDIRNKFVDHLGIHYSELDLNLNIINLHIRISCSCSDRSGRLTAVHDLQILDPSEVADSLNLTEPDAACRGGQSIVVGQEPLGRVSKSVPDATVHLCSRHEKGTNVAFK